jgi:hypothetical protein
VTSVEFGGTRATRGRFDGLGLKAIGGWFTGLGLKTRAEVPRRNGAARGGITELASRRSKSVQEALLSNRQKKSWTITPSGQVVRLKISKGISGIVS